MRSSRYQPASKIWSRLFFWVGVGLSAPINWANPRMAFSGVRSSWLMLDKKSDLAWLALSATCRASSSAVFWSCSSWSICLRAVVSPSTMRNTSAPLSSMTVVVVMVTQTVLPSLLTSCSSQVRAVPVDMTWLR